MNQSLADALISGIPYAKALGIEVYMAARLVGSWKFVPWRS